MSKVPSKRVDVYFVLERKLKLPINRIPKMTITNVILLITDVGHLLVDDIRALDAFVPFVD